MRAAATESADRRTDVKGTLEKAVKDGAGDQKVGTVSTMDIATVTEMKIANAQNVIIHAQKVSEPDAPAPPDAPPTKPQEDAMLAKGVSVPAKGKMARTDPFQDAPIQMDSTGKAMLTERQQDCSE